MLPQNERSGGALTPRSTTSKGLSPMLSKSSTTCSIDGCDRAAKTRGWCRLHYKRWLAHGDPLAVNPHRPTLEQRFWSKVDTTGDCWIWKARWNSWGYGEIRVQGRMILAHRVSYEMHFGDIPEGLFVLHRCDRPACVNPNHLFLGTHEDNMQDMVEKRRARMGSAHPHSKLSESDVLLIRSLYINGGVKQSELAEKFGVKPAAISRIVTGRGWKHV